MSEIISESAQAPEAQRHTLIHEATAEMVRRDTRKEEVLSQIRSELQYYHQEGQSEEFQQSRAELRQNLKRSNAEGVQVRNQCEETRTANASVTPEVLLPQAREAQLSIGVGDAKTRDRVTNTVADSPSGKCLAQ